MLAVPEGYRPLRPGVWLQIAAAQPPALELLVFDIDGVLVDTEASYPLAVTAAVEWFCRQRLGRPAGEACPVGPADLPAWKAAGGFNDDWQLAQGVCLYLTDCRRRGAWAGAASGLRAFTAAVAARGGGLAAVRALCPGADGPPFDPEGIARVGMERYGGDEACAAMFGLEPRWTHGPGLWRLERPRLGAAALQPWRGRLGLYTGRNDGETGFALRSGGLEALFPPAVWQTSDGAWRKPHPGGLIRLARAAEPRPRAVLFVGDTPDDQEAARRYRAEGGDLPPLLFAGILGGAAGAQAAALFAAGGADLIAADPEALLAALPVP